MVKLTPQQAAEKLKTRIQQSGTAYQQGIQNVTTNPAEQAIAAKQKWEAGIQDAIANDRYAKGLANVTLQGWKQNAINYGVPRYTGSGDKAAVNYQAFAERFYPFLQQVQQEVANMPNLTFQDNLQRMITNATRLREFRNT